LTLKKASRSVRALPAAAGLIQRHAARGHFLGHDFSSWRLFCKSLSMNAAAPVSSDSSWRAPAAARTRRSTVNAASAYAGKQHQGNHQGADLEFEAEKAGKRPHARS
jgi:hypothetical protein